MLQADITIITHFHRECSQKNRKKEQLRSTKRYIFQGEIITNIVSALSQSSVSLTHQQGHSITKTISFTSHRWKKSPSCSALIHIQMNKNSILPVFIRRFLVIEQLVPTAILHQQATRIIGFQHGMIWCRGPRELKLITAAKISHQPEQLPGKRPKWADVCWIQIINIMTLQITST